MYEVRLFNETFEVGEMTLIQLWERHAVLSYALSHSLLTFGENYEHPVVEMYFTAGEQVMLEIRRRHDSYRG